MKCAGDTHRAESEFGSFSNLTLNFLRTSCDTHTYTHKNIQFNMKTEYDFITLGNKAVNGPTLGPLARV